MGSSMLTSRRSAFAARPVSMVSMVPALLLLATSPAFGQTTRPASAGATSTGEPSNWIQAEGLVVAWVPWSLEEQSWRETRGRTHQPTRDELLAGEQLMSPDALSGLQAMGVNLIVLPYGGYG